MEFFVQYIVPALGTLLAALITAGTGILVVYLNKKKEELEVKLDNEFATKYLDMITKTVENVVASVNQTYVSTLKKENAFTKEEQVKAFNTALTEIKQLLGEDCLAYIDAVTQDVDTYLKVRIEAEVLSQK